VQSEISKSGFEWTKIEGFVTKKPKKFASMWLNDDILVGSICKLCLIHMHIFSSL